MSGLAYGIDIFAHRASLKSGLSTVGIMASGLDIIYPSSHKKTALQMIEENGGLISENPFGTKPDASRFPARNRIIAGMSDAVVVIEAKSKGGALITAEIANSYDKDVFAVPGNIGLSTSEGCNYLIKSHKANLITGIKDLEYIMNWSLTETKTPIQKNLYFDDLDISDEERKILELLKEFRNQGLRLDEISWRLNMSVSKVSSYLLSLELLGLVKAMPGKKFSLS